MQKPLLKKGIAVAVIVLFLSVSVVSSTGNISKVSSVCKSNNPPYEPSNPCPPNGSTNWSCPGGICWTGGDPDGDEVTYDVYFEKTSPPPKIMSNITTNCTIPYPLQPNTTYYWKIVAWDEHGASTKGPIWSFTTMIYPGKTLYVGGDGLGNYTKIQDAIDNASDGDTVFVYNGTYTEAEINVNKAITLMGEDRNTTIIENNFNDYVINISVDEVTIRGFTIRNFDIFYSSKGILISSDHNYVYGNIISTSGCDIYLMGCWNKVNNNIFYHIEFPNRGLCSIYCGRMSFNVIQNNEINGPFCFDGIMCSESSYHRITGNIINKTGCGIYLYNSTNCGITWNKINENGYGIALMGNSSDNVIFKNEIRNNLDYGIFLNYSFSNHIKKNNFIKNKRNAFFVNSRFNSWDRNYWNRPRILPKPIFGKINFIFYPWIQFDWHPAREPYDIGV